MPIIPVDSPGSPVDPGAKVRTALGLGVPYLPGIVAPRASSRTRVQYPEQPGQSEESGARPRPQEHEPPRTVAPPRAPSPPRGRLADLRLIDGRRIDVRRVADAHRLFVPAKEPEEPIVIPKERGRAWLIVAACILVLLIAGTLLLATKALGVFPEGPVTSPPAARKATVSLETPATPEHASENTTTVTPVMASTAPPAHSSTPAALHEQVAPANNPAATAGVQPAHVVLAEVPSPDDTKARSPHQAPSPRKLAIRAQPIRTTPTATNAAPVRPRPDDSLKVPESAELNAARFGALYGTY